MQRVKNKPNLICGNDLDRKQYLTCEKCLSWSLVQRKLIFSIPNPLLLTNQRGRSLIEHLPPMPKALH